MSGSEKKATEEEQVSFLTYLYNLAKKQPEAIPKAGPPPVTCSMENGRLVTHIGKGWREADSRKSMEGTLTITVTHRGRTHILHLSRYTEACIKRNTKHHLFESLTKALQVPQTEVEKVGKRSVRRWWDPKANNWFVDGYTYDGIDHQLYLPMELWTVFRHKYREWRDVELLWRALVREIWKVPADAPTTTVELSETPPTTIVSQADTIWTSPQHSEEGKATLIPQTYSRTTLSEQPGESWMTSLH
ncbi:hypothetical protein CSUI_010308 [Cystoisospora suis]|uniref:Uncharacterized protein n=1 Tax=Cystoisospora suis TaxID=483139 RepID=A0A2C6KFI3_9APIC|nr:hypothetical protein CSUI_010308 [Cystoisospora suis]